jgi:hypothetical protein
LTIDVSDSASTDRGEDIPGEDERMSVNLIKFSVASGVYQSDQKADENRTSCRLGKKVGAWVPHEALANGTWRATACAGRA